MFLDSLFEEKTHMHTHVSADKQLIKTVNQKKTTNVCIHTLGTKNWSISLAFLSCPLSFSVESAMSPIRRRIFGHMSEKQDLPLLSDMTRWQE